MKMMSEGLEKLADNRLRSILTAMTRNRFMGVVTGIVVYFNNALAYATEATYFRVTAAVSGRRYTFTFADNGAGVPERHLPHLFERFYRIDKGRSRRLGGTGLGLAIVKNIALQYGGSATAMPTPGGGLTIEVEVRGE